MLSMFAVRRQAAEVVGAAVSKTAQHATKPLSVRANLLHVGPLCLREGESAATFCTGARPAYRGGERARSRLSLRVRTRFVTFHS